ncbi:Leishmanolysin peptidase [Fasciola hepatica]|uniref:Leishmanolysin-like peptidase n=1 Tax=Fasciola hepatica TaxID=6192 RepID=A0A4E0R5X6_FASHE|nr:Leishmanolysin peptidase [Fasciola hepatica]
MHCRCAMQCTAIRALLLMRFCVFLLTLCNVANSAYTLCQHDALNLTDVVTRVSVNPRRISTRSSSGDHLRIHIHYDESITVLNDFDYIRNNVVEVAAEFWKKALRLRFPIKSERLLLDRLCVDGLTKLQTMNGNSITFCVNGCRSVTKCGPIQIPAKHLNRCRSVSSGSYALSGEQGEGLSDTDFVLYIAILPTSKCKTSKVLGYASHCQLAAKTDRPVAGYINFCPGALSQKPMDSMRSLFIAKHELLHALGFSNSLFAMYRDPLGRPLTPRDPKTELPALGWSQTGSVYQWSSNVVKTVTRRWLSAYGNQTKEAHIVVTPTVVRVARDFFNCPTLDGVELEDQDERGVFLTHWEKRILENELMTATYTNSYRISPITLAMMEDTGWYLANYSMSHDFSWGRGRGCAFATASCLEYMLEQKKRLHPVTPFCQQMQPPKEHTEQLGVQVSCTPDGVSYGFCNLMVHAKPLAPQYVYFVQTKQAGNWSPVQPLSILELGNGWTDDARPLDYVGGKIALANYCPFFQEIEWERDSGQSTVNTHCHATDNYKSPQVNYKLERFSSTSVCVSHGPNWRLSNGGHMFALPVEGAGCYTFRCSREEGGLVIELEGGLAIPCTIPGNLISVKACLVTPAYTVHGSLICPDCRLLCDPSECPSVSFGLSAYPVIEQFSSPNRTPVTAMFASRPNRHPRFYSSHPTQSPVFGKKPYIERQQILPDQCPQLRSISSPSMTRSSFSLCLRVVICHFLFHLTFFPRDHDCIRW